MTAARKKIPLNAETVVLTASRRRCCLCAYLDEDWNAKLGQIAHLDQDPSNNASDNLAFLCFMHHSIYDSKASQHKNFTILEVKHWRDELCRALTELPTPTLSTPLLISGRARTDEYRARDLETIKTVLRSIHWPTLDNHIQELPLLIYDPIFHFWEGFNGVISSSLYHIYDSSIASAIQELHRQWSVTVSLGIHYMPKGNGSYIFANPGHRPLTHEEERDWGRIQKASVALAKVKGRLLGHIRRAFGELDIDKLSSEAWREYSAFQNRFSKIEIATRDAENEERLTCEREAQMSLAPTPGIGCATGDREGTVDPSWQQLSSAFTKLADEETGKRRLSVMATQELGHSGDIAIWSINDSYTENFKARFELLASQAGQSIGPLPEGARPFSYWLHRLYQHLREKRSNLSRFQTYTAKTDVGNQVSLECPLIEAVCEASSTFCLRLQKRVIEEQHQRKGISACFQDWIENNSISVTIPAQISERNRVSLVAESAGTPIPIEFLSSRLQEIRLPRGGVAFGSPRKFLDSVAETHGLMWVITQRGLWMARQPPSVGMYIDSDGMQHGDTTLVSLPSEGTFTRRTAQLLNILIASPSDVAEERDVIERAILEWNASHLENMGVMLHPVRWEHDAYPASGDRPQGILNKQIVESGDVLVGIFGHKLGTPTGRAQSGTIEEIEEFRKAGKYVALYFSLADVPRSADRGQLEALEAYKRARQKDTLYFEFKDASQLREHITRHLPKIVGEVRRTLKESGLPARNQSSTQSGLEDLVGHGLPNLELAFASGTAALEDSTLCWSKTGNYCISIRVYNKPAAEMTRALVAREIVASISLKLGSRVASVESSCWMEHDASQIDLRPGAHAHALLAFLDRNELTMYENPNPISRKNLEWNSPFSEPERVQFPLGVLPATFTGELHVISRANHLNHTTLAHRRFTISIDDRGSGLPGINVKWADSSVASESPAPASQVPSSEFRGPEIELLDVETSAVHLDGSEIWRIGQMTGREVRAFLLPFYLDPKTSSPGARVEYAMAHLVFVSEASVKTRIAHGCWINAPLDCTEMRPGETKYLILAIGSSDSSGPFVALSTNRTSVRWENEAGGKAFEDFELSPGKCKLEITLIWGGDSEFRRTFELSLIVS